jgi:crossover junction endodeoxyribonuclease RuvC
MPGQGVSSVFSFGRTYGAIEGVVASLGIPMRRVVPQVWIKKMKVRNGKDGARAMAMELFPHSADKFARKKDHNRADAALLAYYASKWETL